MEEGKCCIWVVPNAVGSGVVDVGLSDIHTSIYCFFGDRVSVALATLTQTAGIKGMAP